MAAYSQPISSATGGPPARLPSVCHPHVLAPLQERLTGLHVGQHSVAGSSLGSGSAGRPAGRASVPAASRSRSSFAAACRLISVVAAQPLARASPARRRTDRGVIRVSPGRLASSVPSLHQRTGGPGRDRSVRSLLMNRCPTWISCPADASPKSGMGRRIISDPSRFRSNTYGFLARPGSSSSGWS